MRFLTEADLRARSGLGRGGELRLTHDERLTPAAQNLLKERGIKVLHVNESGQVGLPDGEGGIKRVAALRTDNPAKTGKRCSQCGCQVEEKPETLTQLDAGTLAPKTHPRIILRGKLDSLIATAVLTQTQFDREKKLAPELSVWLADLRSWCGAILKAEVTGLDLPELGMGELDFKTIREFSHFPVKHLGHDHIVPDVSHGFNAALLNRFRAEAREAELCAAALPAERTDLIRALNRLSSAVYVLMLLTVLSEKGARLPDICKEGSHARV